MINHVEIAGVNNMKTWKLKMRIEGPLDEETGIPKWTYEEYEDNGVTKWDVF